MFPMLVSPPIPTPQTSVGSFLTPKRRKAPGKEMLVCVEHNFHSFPCLLFQKSLYPSTTAVVMSYATLSLGSQRGHSSATVLICLIPLVSFPGSVCSQPLPRASEQASCSLLSLANSVHPQPSSTRLLGVVSNPTGSPLVKLPLF